VIAAKATECGAPLIQRGVDYDFSIPPGSGASLTYREPANEPRYELAGVRLGMLGNHQAANAAAAIAAVQQLRQRGWSISDEALRRGLAATRCPARIELVARRPDVILDVAHNCSRSGGVVRRQERLPRARILVFASSKDKDYAGMLKLLVPAFDVIFSQYIHNPRAMEPEACCGLLSRTANELAVQRFADLASDCTSDGRLATGAADRAAR
jgi:dihydrofolate synthase/folylpolyglutamate synthase